LKQTIKVLFASGSQDLIPTAIEEVEKLFPELPLTVVSEFPVSGLRPGMRWIPYPAARSLRENWSLLRWTFRDKRIRIAAVILQPRTPYRGMQLIAFLLAPRNFLAFNENFGHFMLRPQSLMTILRHISWRTRNFFVWQLSPGGPSYVLLWTLLRPSAWRHPLRVFGASVAGMVVSLLKAILPRRRRLSLSAETRPTGISVIIPSRDGKELLAQLLPDVVRQIDQIGGEIIVIDNGSKDDTAGFLAHTYPLLKLESSPTPLSFSRAVNAGIGISRFSHVCLLNNDMIIKEGFFEALLAAFNKVPELFCATAQIFFVAGARREETGKAIMPPPSRRAPLDFPLRCDAPLPGEDLSYVLYGSGGCSLFDTEKLLTLGGMDEIYDPVYVEDLDLGFRAWQQGWPSVFVAGAQTIHMHRATTSKYYPQEYLEELLELHYLRFLARTITSPRVFFSLWRHAIRRLSVLSATNVVSPQAAPLAKARHSPFWIRRPRLTELSDQHILAVGSGMVSVIPGRPFGNRPVVLLATPYLPFPLAHGGAVRMFNLMRRAAQDFDQVLVCFTPEPAAIPDELLELCCEVVQVKRIGTHLLPSTERPEIVEEFDSPAFHAALRQTVRKWKPGIVQLEFTQMAQYTSDCAPAKVILIEHDVTLDLYQQLLKSNDDWEVSRQLDRWIPFEVAAWREVDRVVTMSEKDRQLTISFGINPQRTVCLPNGVDLKRFQPICTPPEPRRLLFIGTFAHLPNLLAIEFFLREVWPQVRPHGATLHIIAGKSSQYYLDRYQDRVSIDLAQSGIEVEDFVADVRPAYGRAAVVIAPHLASAGTNIKIMEAMAMGKPIVSTPAGVNGLDLDPDQDVMIASTAIDMARSILELFGDTAKRECLGRQARATVENRFSWDSIARSQKLLYHQLLNGREG